MPQTRDTDFLTAALLGYQEMLKQIDSHIAALRQRLNVVAPVPKPAAAPKKHRLSPTGRAHVVAALKKRWAAATKDASSQPANPKPATKKAKGQKAATKRATRKAAARTVKRAAVPKRATQKNAPTKKVAVERIAAEKAQVGPVAVERITAEQARVTPVAALLLPETPAPSAHAATE
jgi:hypothetical protein